MKIICVIMVVLLFQNAFAQNDSTKTQLVPATKDNTISFSGYTEAYYSYDLNRPPDNNRPGFIYSHNRHNEFNINLAFFRGSYVAERTRANLAIGAGTYMNANYSAEPGVLKNVYEANAGYKLSLRKNIWLDLGILPSHIGWESAISKDCWTVTRSLAAENTPFYEGGARISYENKNGQWLLAILALNGWQRITRLGGNSLMSWGTQIQYKPNEKVLFNHSSFFGTDKPDSTRTWRYFHDFYCVFQLSSGVGLTLGFDYGQEQARRGSHNLNSWYTPVGILRITPSAAWALALRGEYYCDPHEILIVTPTAKGFRTSGISCNIDFLPSKNIAMRLEGKRFQSKDNIFIRNQSSTNNDTAITFSTAIAF